MKQAPVATTMQLPDCWTDRSEHTLFNLKLRSNLSY